MKLPAAISSAIRSLDNSFLWLEKRSSLFGVSVLVATVLMCCAILYVGFARLPIYHGVFYAELASNPFSPGNPNAFRILTPLMGYLTGLRADRIIILNALIALSLLAIVYFHLRRRQYAPTLAFAATAMLALTMPTLFTLFYGGYTDSTTYLLIFLMMVFSDRPVAFWTLFFLGMLNRESVVFLLPFFALLHLERLKPARRFVRSISLGIAAVAIAYVGFRFLISSQTAVKHSTSFYLEPLKADPLFWLRQSAGAYPLGVFSAFKLFWILPLVALVIATRKRSWMTFSLILSPIILSAAQSIIAVDTSRMLSMAFPSLFLSVALIREQWGDSLLAVGMLSLLLLNLLLPQHYVTSNYVFSMR